MIHQLLLTLLDFENTGMNVTCCTYKPMKQISQVNELFNIIYNGKIVMQVTLALLPLTFVEFAPNAAVVRSSTLHAHGNQ